jgi:zinc/manganese transport system substrate-binding protein
MRALLLAVALLPMAPLLAAAAPIPVIAAENFYGDVARQVGGPEVTVTSILENPDVDPHLFEVSPSVARAVVGAAIVVYNGIDYDPWMAKLIAAAGGSRKVIVVAAVLGKKPGDNPHIWYDPQTMPKLATALAAAFAAADPAQRADFARRLAGFRQSLQPVLVKIAALRTRLAGTAATATEPVFGCMFAALGMEVRNRRFQRAVMNNTEPSAADVAAFEDDLKSHKVRLLVYNSQASDPIAAQMVRIAKASGIPVVGATETEPPGEDYQSWMLRELDAVDRALPK